MQAKKTTPLMQQYFEIKKRLPDSLLFFQVGDFYELFLDDAKKAAQFLGIALTKRGMHNNEPIPLCGVPLHASDFYIAKLVRGGFKVAVCDQLEEAQPGKVVQRGVKQVYTPGTLTDSKLLDEKTSSYLAAVYGEKSNFQVIFGELLTGKLYATAVDSLPSLEAELARFAPDEVIVPGKNSGKNFVTVVRQLGYFTTELNGQEVENKVDDFVAWYQHLQRSSVVDISAALRIFHGYLSIHHTKVLAECKSVQIYSGADFLVLDAATQKNLELVKNSVDGSSKYTLFSVLDRAKTPMGSRTVKKWLLRPLINQKKIDARLQVVASLVTGSILREQLQSNLKSIGDLERILGRISLDRASLHDYVGLKNGIGVVPQVVSLLAEAENQLLKNLAVRFADFSALYKLLQAALSDDGTKDTIIKTGFDQELDRLRQLAHSSTNAIAALEKKEQAATNISSLKIRYSSVHGYFIEVTKANFSLVPERYQRVQTLVGRERYTTQELKDLERDVQRAHNEIGMVEKEIYGRVKAEVTEYLSKLHKACQVLAYLDALAGFAEVAYFNQYVRPTFNSNRDIIIEDGRHPVVEQMLDAPYIPNNVMLTSEQALWMITGPNMGGKSTFLRQVALTCIMAQCGAFVPAASVSLPIIDRIFTRIGASDKVSQGKSTFLVEMEETALICKQATKHSLVILDEVGRGTSTYDGLAIAQAVVEYLHKDVGARGLFATHYHELTDLEKKYPGIVAYYAASRRHGNKLIFLYKILRGNGDGSFGIDVAELAELPSTVIIRAREILSSLS